MNVPPCDWKREHLSVTEVGWEGYPYFVEISEYDKTYLKVECEKGYRPIPVALPGYIASTTRPRRVQSIFRRYVRIAWRRNRRSARYLIGDMGRSVDTCLREVGQPRNA